MQQTFEFDQELEDQFVSLVETSWERYDDIERNSWLDDVFVGAVVTAHLDEGLFLLTTTSDGVSHYLMFSNPERDRFIVRVDHRRGEDYLFSKTVGHLMAVEVRVGRSYPNLSKIWKATKSEMKGGLSGKGRISGFEDPGVMKIDAEGTIAYCHTTLLLDVKDYVDTKTLEADQAKIWSHIQATYQSLEKYLAGVMS